MRETVPLLGMALVASLGLACDKNDDLLPEPDTKGQELKEDLAVTADDKAETDREVKEQWPRATADFQSVDGEKVGGTVELMQREQFVKVSAELSGLPPGKLGFHVHEEGDCSDIAGNSMGSHLNPEGEQHKLPHEGIDRHLGDLGNLDVDADGNAEHVIRVEGANLQPDLEDSFLGKALVIHSGPDEGFAEQPAGDSGAPVACAVIRAI